MSEVLSTLSDEQYDAVRTVIDVVMSKMTIHDKNGNMQPLPLTDEQTNAFNVVKQRADYEVILKGARDFISQQFPAMDVSTAHGHLLVLFIEANEEE